MIQILHYLDINTIFFTVWDYPMSYIEFFGTVFNILCVWLVSRNKISNWPIGILGVVLYIFLFYQIQLYADLIEQGYFLVTSFYGRWVWAHMKKNPILQGQDITPTSFRENVVYGVITVIFTFVFMYVVTHLSLWFPQQFSETASYPFRDSLTTVMSFVATILMARKKISCWYLWIAVDIIGIWLYYNKGVKFIALEYVVFLVLATLGLFQWIKLYKQTRKNTNMD